MAGPDRARHQTISEISDPPKPAPNVQFAGQVKDGAYKGRQYLVQREGQFVQLTELLFLTLAHVDGERTIEQIAAGVAAKAFRKVNTDNVRELLKKLVPLGLVADAQGNIAATPRETAARSPMQLQLKMAVLPAGLVNAVTGLFAWLYLPPVLIAVLAASLLAHAWLYVVHGVGRSVHDVLYSPGLVLLLIGAFVLSAAFHETGHAAGLRYGGGKVRAMGVGLYLIYPVFYTDISDAYRLGRGARLRTSLGGFYFNLIFSLGVLALYAATRAEFLLLVMALIDLEIVYQMLPFVRMDGYWILADLTGIPDFFSQMGGFIRGILGRDDADVPELKPWAKVVFALYTIIVVPLIAFLLFLMFRSFPTVVATGLDSAGKLAVSAGDGLGHGDGLPVAAAAMQIAILGLQVGGIALVVFNVLKRIFVGLWRWGKPSPGRRALSTAASLAVVAALVFLWTPALPTGAPGPLAAYTATSFHPLPDTARGTLSDAVPAVDAIVPPSVRDSVPLATPLPTGASGPSSPATAAPSAIPVSTPSATSTPTASATPAPSGTP